ncbi:MAG: hypothetical protein Q8P53_00460 [Candidatus Shapirobacteria bacterium]|nr:hypothetical protein [Candidatus Shapirobacteria bacterium]
MILGIFRILGIILFLYLTWRNLREDYREEDLISYSWLSMLAFFLGGRLIFGLMNWGIWNENYYDWINFWQKPGISFTGGYVVFLIISYLVANQRGWKLLTLAEDIINSFMVFISLIFLEEVFKSNFDLKSVSLFLALIFGWFLTSRVKKKYRSFVWYKSGKKGFAYFFANFIIMFLLGLILFWFKEDMVYPILYLSGSLIFLIGLFILGEVFEPLQILGRKK